VQLAGVLRGDLARRERGRLAVDFSFTGTRMLRIVQTAPEQTPPAPGDGDRSSCKAFGFVAAASSPSSTLLL